MLDHCQTLIVPLQRRGIKVLLGITGGADDISFGSIEDLYFQSLANYDIHFYQQGFADEINQLLRHYSLDGVEFNDTGAAKSANPATYPYPNGSYEGVTVNKYGNENEQQNVWKEGGDQMNFFFWLFRILIQGYENRPIIIREKNYGSYLDWNTIGSLPISE